MWRVTRLTKFWFRQPSQTCRDMCRIFRQFSAAGNEKFLYLAHAGQMISAHEIDRDHRDISAFWRAPWRVTAELNVIVQY